MTHARAVALMLLVTLLWSIAGVVTRHLDAARSFEVTFWRSLFNALALAIALTVLRGPALWSGLLRAPWPVWVSGVCWSVMFTAFMVAITLTTVANVLVTMAIGPLITALFARFLLHHRLPMRTWAAIAVAGLGIAWMFGQAAGAGLSVAGTLVALVVPLAAASNWTVLQHVAQSGIRTDRGNGDGISEGNSDGNSDGIGDGRPDGPNDNPSDGKRSATSDNEAQDMLPAVLIGALLSTLVTLPLSLPFAASAHDVGWLALLGVVQLAVPCLLVVRLTRELPSPEIALLGLLEVVFGVAWAWLGAGERPGASTVVGGALVLGALGANEALALQQRTRRRLSA